MGLGIAIKAFSAALLNRDAAGRLRAALEASESQTARLSSPSPESVGASDSAAPTSPPRAAPLRSDAVTLLSALQRESRLVDLIQEDLTQFSDAQVGAAARPCLQSCASTLSRLMGIEPVSDSDEGTTIEVGEDPSPARYQWTGEGTGTRGTLVHQGWQAVRVELPQWTGDAADAQVIAPAQIQR